MKVRPVWKDIYLPMLLAFSVAILLKAFAFDIMISEGDSMKPAIEPGSVILVNRLAYGLRLPFANRYAVSWKDPRRGDILVFTAPDGRSAIKRCALTHRDRDPRFDSPPPGSIIVLGDNSAQSWDSRSYGPVPFDAIQGKVMVTR